MGVGAHKACEAAGGIFIHLGDREVACIIPRRVKVKLEWYGEEEKVRELDRAVVFCGDIDLEYDEREGELEVDDGVVVGRVGDKLVVGYAAWGEYARWLEAGKEVKEHLRRII